MITATETKTPRLITALPGQKARGMASATRDHVAIFTRDYPLVGKTGRGAMVKTW